MCGIVGLGRLDSTDLYEKDREVFMQLLHTGVVRGHHGTGIFAVDREGSARIVKSAGPPYLLMMAKEFNAFWAEVKMAKTHILVGHNRFATTGQKITAHAHPFVAKHIVMVHNGSLETSSALPDFKKFDVDSEALANAIATIGIEDTIKNTMGAYAIVYWDSKAKTLNMIRNAERPLHLMTDKLLKRVMFASEPDMLAWVAKRNFYDVPASDIKVLTLPPNVLWTFSYGSLDPVETPIMGKSRTVVYMGYTGDYYKDQEWDPVKAKWVKKGNVYELEPNDERQRIIDLFLDGFPERPAKAAPPKSEPKQGVLMLPKPHISGKAANDPRLREVFVNTKEYVQGASFQNPTTKAWLARGDKISVMISDHIPENAEKQQHIVIAEHEDWPKVRFQFRVTSDGALDAMFEAVVVEVTVQNFLAPKVTTEEKEVIVWANDPKVLIDRVPENSYPSIH